jgi:phosphatidate cytidylyltransferase
MRLAVLTGLLAFSGLMLLVKGEASMLMLAGGVVGGLLCVSLIGHVLARCRFAMAEEIQSRTMTWWCMVAVFLLALSTHRAVSFVCLSFLCFSALREFYSLMPMKEVAGDKTLAFKDRVAVLFSYLALPIVAWVAYVDWFDLFIIVVPVYLFLLFPIIFVLQERTEGALKSLGVVNVGAMFFVFNLGHCLFMINLTPMLLFYCFTLTEVRDVVAAWSNKGFAQLAATCPGTPLARVLQCRVAEAVDGEKTWAAGFVSSVVVALLSLAFLPLMPAFKYGVLSWPVCLVLGLLIGFLGLMGELVFAMVKQDLQIKSSSGVIERVDSLVFTLPIVFHVIYWVYF